MAFTKGRWEAYTAHTDGTQYVTAKESNVISGTATATKTAAGDYGLSVAASETMILAFPLPEIIRFGEPHLEEVTPYEQYNPPTGPPYTIAGPTAQSPVSVLKGVQLTSVDLIYSIAGLALTANTVGVFAKQDLNNAAPSITTLLAQGANGMATGIQADRYVTNVPIPAAAQNFIVTPDTVLTVEWDLDTGATGTAVVYGVVFNYNFNLN